MNKQLEETIKKEAEDRYPPAHLDKYNLDRRKGFEAGAAYMYDSVEKRITAAQREIVGGYYSRIFRMEQLDKETILQWFEDDLRYIAGEEAVQSVKQILKS